MHLIMAFRSISRTLLTPVLTFGLGSTHSVRHCIPQSEEIGQNRQTFGISGEKMWRSTKMKSAIQLSRSRRNALCGKMDGDVKPKRDRPLLADFNKIN